MSHDHEMTTIIGTITDIFAHRFVVQTSEGKSLADLGKYPQEKFVIKSGDKVELEGERKPSEIKVHKMILNGKIIKISHKEKDDPKKDEQKKHRELKNTLDADMNAIMQTAHRQNLQILAHRRMPKHVEVLAISQQNSVIELHIELDGTLRKSHAANRDDEKWAADMPPRMAGDGQ